MTVSQLLAVGIGCDRGVAVETVETALFQALHNAGLELRKIARVASIDIKNDEQALWDLAEKYQWPLLFYPASELAEIDVPNPSEVVRRYTGTPAVAEAAAIKSAGGSMQDLLVEKHKYLGMDNKNVTISIARILNLN